MPRPERGGHHHAVQVAQGAHRADHMRHTSRVQSAVDLRRPVDRRSFGKAVLARAMEQVPRDQFHDRGPFPAFRRHHGVYVIGKIATPLRPFALKRVVPIP